MSSRERFEEWYLAEFWEGSNGGRAMLKKEPCGGYTYAKSQELWKVWQAAQPAAGEPAAWECFDGRYASLSYERGGDPDRAVPLFRAALPAAAHGDEAVLWEMLEELRTATDRQALPGAFIRVMWEAGCDWINARAAMRAQAGEGGE